MTDTPKDRKELEKAFDRFCEEIEGSDEYQVTYGRALTLFIKRYSLAVVPVPPNAQMLSDCVVAMVDAGLDGPDGIGPYEANKVAEALIAANPFKEPQT